MTPNKSHGFTLIEIMIVVVIISILSAIAIPAYTDYVTRAKIMEAVSGLSAMQTRMEQCYQDAHTYSGCAVCTTVPISDNFGFACTAATATAFTVTATGQGSVAGFVYTVDEHNNKKTTSVASGWSQHSPDNCWVTRKGGIC
jgi:type IV pilus assembly protein PilE